MNETTPQTQMNEITTPSHMNETQLTLHTPIIHGHQQYWYNHINSPQFTPNSDPKITIIHSPVD